MRGLPSKRGKSMANVKALVLAAVLVLVDAEPAMATVSEKAPTPVVMKSSDPVRSKAGPATSRSYARTTMLSRYRWNKVQYRCLDNIWTRESNWNHKAKNKHSSAFGIPQMLGLKAKDPRVQIDKGLEYIKSRYGTPCKAWKFWRRHGWY